MKMLKGRITLEPDFCGGRPFFKGTRVPVYVVLEMLANREKEEDILAAYPDLQSADLTDALDYARNLAAIPRQPLQAI
jgi:uncharacterized protein (DUF433 family)